MNKTPPNIGSAPATAGKVAAARAAAPPVSSTTVATTGQKANAVAPNPSAPNPSAPKQADGQPALLALLKVEADARDALNERDLVLLMSNETRKLTRARQVFVLQPGMSGRLEVRGISSVPSVDRTTPLVALIEDAVRAAASKSAVSGGGTIAFAGGAAGTGAESYPFRSLYFLPLRHGSAPSRGGLVLAREEPWGEQDLVVAKRLSSAYAHALGALKGPAKKRLWTPSRLQTLLLFAAALAALLFIEVPLRALAPVEVIARDPFVVAAPIDGVIEAIPVEPNQKVKAGDILVKLADTTLKNRFEVADREVQVAEARLKQSNQIAFSDSRGMHEIGIARAELSLKLAERDFARDLLAKTQIAAPHEGLAIYSDRRDLIGRPVAVGERILEIAEPAKIEARIDLPVADAIALTPGASVKLFLDSDPLRPWPATVQRADYKAKIGENDIVSFRVVAAVTAQPDRPLPRLGVRGTAQVSGGDVSLGLYLFRRPITYLRQWIGL